MIALFPIVLKTQIIIYFPKRNLKPIATLFNRPAFKFALALKLFDFVVMISGLFEKVDSFFTEL